MGELKGEAEGKKLQVEKTKNQIENYHNTMQDHYKYIAK